MASRDTSYSKGSVIVAFLLGILVCLSFDSAKSFVYTNKIGGIEVPKSSKQDSKTNYMPVKYGHSDFQKVAQSFTVSKVQTVSGVKLELSFGAGNDINLYLYDFTELGTIGQEDELARATVSAKDIVKNSKQEFTFEEPVKLKPGNEYIFVVEAGDKLSQTSVQFTYDADEYAGGEMFIFTRLIGGNGEILEDTHSWQPRNDQDVVFELK